MAKKYDVNQIKSHERLEIIRGRPQQFIEDCEIKGLTRLTIELLDNSIDEIQMMGNSGKLTLVFCNDKKHSTYHIMVIDNGRGIPVDTTKSGIAKFLDVMTKPHTSGKFTSNAYEISVGQLGCGNKVTSGLSEKLKVVSLRPKVSAMLSINKGQYDSPIVEKAKNGVTGTYVIYTPDKSIFKGCESYLENGYELLMDRIKKYCIFKNFNINVYFNESSSINEIYLSRQIQDTLSLMDNLVKDSKCIWSSKEFNTETWLRKYFRIKAAYDFYYEHKFTNTTTLKCVDFRIGYVRKEKSGGIFGIINNQHINNSDHVTCFIDQLKEQLCKKIQNKDISKFFLSQYKFPIYLAINVEYVGAEFTSAIKDKFKSPVFREIYNSYLQSVLSSKTVDNELLTPLYTIMEDDIKTAYINSLKDGNVNKNRNRLGGSLNFPNNFIDCEFKNNSKTELFLTEGESASGAIGYDKQYQAIYKLKGKPKNFIRVSQNPTDIIKNIYNDQIYADILTILNYDLSKKDMSALNFKKILLMFDADTHGNHITSLILGTFQLIAPELIEAGIFYRVQPPYYAIGVNKKNKNNNVYVKGIEDVLDWKVRNVYYPALMIVAQNYQGYNLRKFSNIREYSELINIVETIGNILITLSKELSIKPAILEGFCKCYKDIAKHEKMDVNKVKKILNADDVQYSKKYNQLIVVGDKDSHEDMVIPLYNVLEKLTKAMHNLMHLGWYDWTLKLTSLKDKTYRDTPIGIFQLYQILTELSKNITVDVLKGLGSMPQKDIAITCMNIDTRHVQQILLADNISTVFKLLGNNSNERKLLLPSPRSTVEE